MYKNVLQLFTLITFLLLPVGVFAQDASSPAVWRPVCVPFVHCGEGAENENCDPLPNASGADAIHSSHFWGHRAQLDFQSVELPPNQNVILMECLQADQKPVTGATEGEYWCTTGFSENDVKFFCPEGSDAESCDVKSFLNKNPDIGYAIEGDSSMMYIDPEAAAREGRTPDANGLVPVTFGADGGGPNYNFFYKVNSNLLDTSDPFVKASATTTLRTDGDGKLNYSFAEIQSHTVWNMKRKFLLYYSPEVVPTPTDSLSESYGGQQQDQLTWLDPTHELDSCEFSGSWDPYGRVFDAVSLEPIPEVPVTLLQKNPEGLFEAAYAKLRNNLIPNPFKTGSAGDFTFYVEDGDYELSPQLAGYIHPSSSEWIKKGNAARIYSDFFLSDSPAILQRGAIQHRDIPFMPTDNIGKSYPLKTLGSDIETAKNGDVIFKGRVSHPFAEVVIDTCKRKDGVEVCGGRQVFGAGDGAADRDGKYEISLSQSKLEPGEYYKKSFRKIDLTTMSSDQEGAVEGESSINPVPAYLEGYAYDSEGNLMTGGYVGIYPVGVPVAHYVEQIADNGYYKITSENIPKEPYTIKYLTLKGDSYAPVASLSIQDYFDQNKEFLISEEVELYKPVTQSNNPRRDVTPEFVPMSTSEVAKNANEEAGVDTSMKNKGNNETANSDKATKPQTNQMYLVGAILLILVGGAGVLLAVYVYKKKSTEDSL